MKNMEKYIKNLYKHMTKRIKDEKQFLDLTQYTNLMSEIFDELEKDS